MTKACLVNQSMCRGGDEIPGNDEGRSILEPHNLLGPALSERFLPKK
jgi:hypothetical protein